MSRFKNPLDRVRIAAPCKADWEQMVGSERVRFCGQCNLNVFNLSSMTRIEAESLIVQTEGRLCVRFYRRTDGSILTENCPVGLRALRKRLSSVANAAAAAVVSFLAGLGIYSVINAPPYTTVMGAITVRTPLMGDIDQTMGELTATPPDQVIMGKFTSRPRPAERKARRRGDRLRTGSTR